MKHRDGWLRFLRRILQMPKEIKRLRAQVEDLRDTLAIRQESIERQASVVIEMKNQKAKLRDELHEARSKIESLKLRVGELQDQLNNLRDSRDNDKRLIKSLEEEIEKLKDKIQMPIVPPSDIDNYAKITIQDMRELLEQKTSPDSPDIYLSDGRMSLFPKTEVERFLLQCKTDEMRYVWRLFDCENFANRLLGEFSVPGWARAAIGIAWGGGHIFNVFVDSEKELYIIEPQTDKITKIEDIKHDPFYFPMQFLMI